MIEQPPQKSDREKILENLKLNLNGFLDYLAGLKIRMADLSEKRILLEQDAPTNPDLKKILATKQKKEEDQILDEILRAQETIKEYQNRIAELEGQDLTPEELAEIEETY
jgi:hypothetical protein